MDNINVGKKKQNRSKGKCWGCDREDVELVSSIWIEGTQQRICDACRKAVTNHSELDPVAVLTSRRQPRSHLITRNKLITLNTQLTRLVSTLRKIGADERVRDAVRTLVEPYLTPVADDIWPKTSQVPPAVPEPAPVAHLAIKGTKPPDHETHTPQPKSHAELPIPNQKPPKAHAKAAAKETVIDRSKGSLHDNARRALNKVNSRRKKKGLLPLPKPVSAEEMIRWYLDRQAKKGRPDVN